MAERGGRDYARALFPLTSPPRPVAALRVRAGPAGALHRLFFRHRGRAGAARRTAQPAETAETLARRGRQLGEANRVDEAMAELSRPWRWTRGSRWPCATGRSCCTPPAVRPKALADIKLAAELKPDDMRTVGALYVIGVSLPSGATPAWPATIVR